MALSIVVTLTAIETAVCGWTEQNRKHGFSRSRPQELQCLIMHIWHLVSVSGRKVSCPSLLNCATEVIYSKFCIARYRERTVQPKLDRSDSVLFSRVRPAIQYRSSTDRLDRGGGRFAAAAAAATLLTATQLTELMYIIALWCVCICLLVLM